MKTGSRAHAPPGPPEARLGRCVGRERAKTTGDHLASAREPRSKPRGLTEHRRAPLPVLTRGKKHGSRSIRMRNQSHLQSKSLLAKLIPINTHFFFSETPPRDHARPLLKNRLVRVLKSFSFLKSFRGTRARARPPFHFPDAVAMVRETTLRETLKSIASSCSCSPPNHHARVGDALARSNPHIIIATFHVVCCQMRLLASAPA